MVRVRALPLENGLFTAEALLECEKKKKNLNVTCQNEAAIYSLSFEETINVSEKYNSWTTLDQMELLI